MSRVVDVFLSSPFNYLGSCLACEIARTASDGHKIFTKMTKSNKLFRQHNFYPHGNTYVGIIT